MHCGEQPEVIELHGLRRVPPVNPELLLYQANNDLRLELCAAVLLAKLVHRQQALKLNVTNTFLWSDFMIVLSWIRKESYQPFVEHRIATIQEMTSSEQWRYVATEDNPVDCFPEEWIL
ncbi:hypothetical protein TNCV_1234421 [Trichonephila clavipes]|nr:hypothetical protein TNCV_1234421 [Trichonephila clavipes]